MAKKMKKLHVKVKPVRLEILPAISGYDTPATKSAMIQVKWKGPVTGFGFSFVPFYRSKSLTNQTSLKPVVGDRHVEWDEEFEHACCLVGPWNLSFNVFYGENIETKNRKALIGKASLDLTELASKTESTAERKLPIQLKGSSHAKEATLVVSVTFSELRDEPNSLRLAQSLLDSQSKIVYTKGGECEEPSCSPATELSSGGLSPGLGSGSSSSPESLSKSGQKIRLFSWKRRRLSFSLSQKREPSGDEGTTNISVEVAKEDASLIDTNKWEVKDLVSRSGRSKLRAEVFFASLDQRSEQASGEAACAAVAVVMAHWFHSNSNMTPSGSELDSLITEGSSLWKSLCNDESYLLLFPNKHFDLETIVSANLRPVRVCPSKSLTGVFSPEKFDLLKGLMSFDEMWGEIEKDVSGIDRGESRVYIVSWNDHFFVMKADVDGFLIIDSLGERLFEGCKQAYILKFDDSSLMYEKKVLEKEKPEEAREGKENPNSNPDSKEEETLVCRGKECCREYIKRFLAAIPVEELAAEEKKGTVLEPSLLHEKLQIDLHHILLTT